MLRKTLLTDSEIRAIGYLFTNFSKKLSINELAKEVNITPKGMFIILKKLESDEIVSKERIANAMIYKIDFNNDKTEDVVKYALKSKPLPNPYVKILFKDLQPLKGVAKSAILFGGVLSKGIEANDIDLMVIIDKDKFLDVKKVIKDFEIISPKKAHLIFQTEDDIKKNLYKKDHVIMNILRTGYILFGHQLIYEVIKNEAFKG